MDDERTSVLRLPLPHPDHLLVDDVLRLREALTTVDTGFGQQRTELQTALEATTVAMADALDALSADTTRQIRRLRLNQLLDLGL